ncbi:MAG TPA: DNA gyrase inhibitor YacG [Terriglobales bacterium]|nr:DNA gyrase inhibitor YacG [Terriglobales bacterium]
MAKKRISGLQCPACHKIVLRSDPEFPFCSERCRLIDLGKWASGAYVVSTPINDPEEGEGPSPKRFRPAGPTDPNAKSKPN